MHRVVEETYTATLSCCTNNIGLHPLVMLHRGMVVFRWTTTRGRIFSPNKLWGIGSYLGIVWADLVQRYSIWSKKARPGPEIPKIPT